MCIYGSRECHLTFMPHRAARLKLVPEEADGNVAQIFAAAKEATGLPFVPELLRAFGSVPEFWQFAWPQFHSAIRGRQFAHCADRLRAQAYTNSINYFTRIPALDWKQEVTATVDMYHCAAPRLLLLSATLLRAMEAPTGQARQSEPDVPAICPAGAPPLADQEITGSSRAILDDYRHSRGAPLANCWMRSLARWPAALENYWNMLKPLIASPVYQRFELELRESAFALAEEWPSEVDLTPERLTDAGFAHAEIAEAGRVMNLFTLEYSAMLLDVEIARIAVEHSAPVAAEPLRQVA